MQSIVHSISNWLIEQNAITVDEKEIYEYSIRSFSITVISIIVAVVLGTVIDDFLSAIVFTVSFLLLRRFSGGYHAASFRRCMCYSCVMLIAVFSIVGKIQNIYGMGIVTLISAASLCHFSPVESAAKVLSADMKKENQSMVRKIISLYAITIVVLLGIHAGGYAIRLAMGIVVVALLQIPCIIMKKN